MLESDKAAGTSVFSCSRQVLVKLLLDELQDIRTPVLVVQIQLVKLLTGVDEIGDVSPSQFVKELPQQVRHVKQHRLEHQDERHPLVVVDHVTRLGPCSGRIRDLLGVEGQVVGVGHPAYLVCVLDVVVGELRWSPAVDLVSDELPRERDARHEREQERRVLVVQAIHHVVVLLASVRCDDSG